MTTYSIQKEVFINYLLSSVSVESVPETMTDALEYLNNIYEMRNSFGNLRGYKEVKDSGTKVTFYFDYPVVIRYKIVRHTL